jgi:acetyl-CoA carboxylase biotin carboxyl carrier protein
VTADQRVRTAAADAIGAAANGATGVNGAGNVNVNGNVKGAGNVNGAAGSPAAGAVAVETGTDEADEAGTFTLGSPSVGMFYRASEPGAAPFVAEGDTVRAGQQVAIVEAMKLMIPIEADRPGRIVRVLVEDATAIEHGQPLFVLAPVTGNG